ncbi:MAG: hypothetical protein CRN43_02285 [Candidatus Nephrothrix sp. EaCA]|nr:MAG: hypothetical protein CRN43_02285 [Candidatus Nephrothrix sp. EaCA]
MIRTIVTPNQRTVSFGIPEEYVGKQIEIIAFAKEEEIAQEIQAEKKVSFTVLHVDAKEYKFNRDEANERQRIF